MPRLRAISISGLVSALKVTSPSTSAGSSRRRAGPGRTASTARRSSLRPDSLENSVAPMPAIAVLPAKLWSVLARRAVPRRGGAAGRCRSRGRRDCWHRAG